MYEVIVIWEPPPFFFFFSQSHTAGLDGLKVLSLKRALYIHNLASC